MAAGNDDPYGVSPFPAMVSNTREVAWSITDFLAKRKAAPLKADPSFENLDVPPQVLAVLAETCPDAAAVARLSPA
eukprot:CAMPEP_0119276812 /NCGR_PEP_ID=MMETSP1329-20130426/16009_1 /TAXON_ID=114041 /ORGANISM="Genus nov. species nov., Strain RCC1024" /LENGTH=75 /DNA_ID=CAMNT_0007277255 /DNA_START=251 /DNA_END=474 /DNA_ORIENTATION=+